MADELPQQWMLDRADAIVGEFVYLNAETRRQASAVIIDAMQEATRQEREACAKVCDELSESYDNRPADCAAAIRSRSSTTG